MRNILSKLTTVSVLTGAALAVAACGGNKAANNTMTDNTTATMPADNYTTTNTMDPMAGNTMGMDTMGNTATPIANAQDSLNNAQESLDNAAAGNRM